MNNSISLRNKLIYIIIFVASLGILSLLPNSNSSKNHLVKDNSVIKDKYSEKATVVCDDFKSDLSIISGNQKEKTSQDSCLFVGCSGFNF